MRSLEEIDKDIRYIRFHERVALFVLGSSELYSLPETNKASDKVRKALLNYLKELEKIRNEYQKEREEVLKAQKI